MNPDAPPGFEKLREGFGFADVLQPLYRRAGDTPAMGMYVRERHINTLGICHGGVLMTLADIVASLSVWRARGRNAGNPTINLSFDFIAAAREGDWIQAEADRVTVKRNVGFSSGVVTSGDGGIVCRFSGGFYLFDRDGPAVRA